MGDIWIFLFIAILIVSWGWYFWSKYRFLKSCEYGIKQKPGQACVICPHNKKCGRAMESESYKLYRRIELLSPEKAREIQERERAEKSHTYID